MVKQSKSLISKVYKDPKFPYETKKSTISKQVKRPIATVDLWSDRFKKWISYSMIIDTDADYTILHFPNAFDLGVNLEKECFSFETRGIGGTETVYLLKRKVEMKISGFNWKNTDRIPLKR